MTTKCEHDWVLRLGDDKLCDICGESMKWVRGFEKGEKQTATKILEMIGNSNMKIMNSDELNAYKKHIRNKIRKEFDLEI